MIPLRTGNLSVSTFKAVWHERALPDPEVDRARLPGWKAAGFDEVEDYVTWGVVEQEPGRWDFSLHAANLDAAEAAGLSPWIYPWLHVSPHWWRRGEHAGDDAPFVPSVCAVTGRTGYFPSLFAEATWTRLQRFYDATADALGARVDGVAIAWPSDYGEVGAASNISRWIFPHRPDGPLHRETFWAGEPEARAALVAWLEETHGTLAAAASRWGVDVDVLAPRADGTPPPFPVPTIADAEALRVDVAAFLRASTRAQLDRLLRVARGAFGGLPLEIKLGHASESIRLARTMRDVVDVAAAHDVDVRSTHSGQATLFHKHIAALCRRAGATFTTEGPRDVGRDVLARRMHDDVAHGSAHLYEFPEQLPRLAMSSAVDALGVPPRRHAVAAVMPSLDLALHPGLGVPEVLTVAFDTFRRVVDFDLVDDAALRSLDRATSVLLWLDGHDVAAPVYDAIAAWVDDGGTLIVGTPGAPRVCDAASDAPLGARGAALRDAITRDDGPARGLVSDAIDALPEASDGPGPDGVVRTHAQPGEELDRLLVGEGWHGRDDGAFGWPEATSPHPVRWTAGRARLRLPRVVGACEARGVLVLDATIRHLAPETVVVVWWNGEAIGRVSYPRAPGPVHLPAPPPRAGVPNLVTLTMPTTRPPAHDGAQDARELGILVREVRWVGVESPADDVGGLASIPGLTIRERATERPAEPEPDPPAAFGRGTVFAGDTTPAGALDALRAWLADQRDAEPRDHGLGDDEAPVLVRCEDASCLVTALRDGVVLHNPSRKPVTPRLVVHGRGRLPVDELAGFATRFVPWPSA